MTYNMWNKNLLAYLKLIQYPLDIFSVLSKEQVLEIIKEAADEVINKEALKLMRLHSLTFYEAKSIIINQLFSKK